MSNTHTKDGTPAVRVGDHGSIYWISLSIVFSILILSITLSYGFQYRVAPDAVARYFTAASVVFVIGMLALAMLTRVRPAPLSRESLRLPAAATGLTLMAVMSSLYFYSGPASLPATPLLVTILTATAILATRRQFKLAIWLLTVCGTALFAYLALSTPIDVGAANMLPVITASCRSMAVGDNPFGKYYPELTTPPMFYLPLNVLPYCAFEWSGSDPRWLNVSLFLALLVVIARKFDFMARPEIVGLIFLPFLFSPMVMQMGYYGHIWPYWFCATLLALAFSERRFIAVAVLLGLMLLTRQMALFVGAMVGVAIIAGCGWRQGLRYGGVALVIFALGMLATQIYSGEAPQNFYLFVATAPAFSNEHNTNPQDQISIAGTLAGLGLRNIMLSLQALTAAILCGIFLRSGSLKPWQVITLVGLGYMTVMSLSVFMHRYFYGSGLLLVASGLTVALKAAADTAADR